MLNSYNIKHETKVCPVTQVIEKTITPDKVTEMYKDVRAEVEEAFVKEFRIEDNNVNGIIVEFQDLYSTRQRKTRTYFKLNGKEYTFEDLLQNREELSKKEMFDIFWKHYQNEITSKIMNVTVQALFSKTTSN